MHIHTFTLALSSDTLLHIYHMYSMCIYSLKPHSSVEHGKTDRAVTFLLVQRPRLLCQFNRTGFFALHLTLRATISLTVHTDYGWWWWCFLYMVVMSVIAIMTKYTYIVNMQYLLLCIESVEWSGSTWVEDTAGCLLLPQEFQENEANERRGEWDYEPSASADCLIAACIISRFRIAIVVS